MQNIDVLWKECLHSDGEQCHQYQQNETHLSLQLIEHKHGEQCHQYQQNETHLSLQLIEHKQRRRHMTLKI